MEAKLKVNVGDHHLEIEGSEAFVQQAYSEFKELVSKASSPASPSHQQVPPGRIISGGTNKSPKAAKAGKSSKGFSRIDIDLRPSGKTSLKDYVSQFETPSKDELYLLSVGYLTDQIGVKNVTASHIYTCLDELNERIPTHLKQVLRNIKNKKGWIDTSDSDDLTITIKGKNHLKHDMPKAKVKA
ncbi:MAG: hypothetical protein ACJ8M1_02860 [Chthoniobacterales bacterium]